MDTAVTGSNFSSCFTKSDDFSHVVVQQLLSSSPSSSVVESITESFFCLLSPNNMLFSILNYLPPCLQLFRCDESKSDSNAVVVSAFFVLIFVEEQREDYDREGGDAGITTTFDL